MCEPFLSQYKHYGGLTQQKLELWAAFLNPYSKCMTLQSLNTMKTKACFMSPLAKENHFPILHSFSGPMICLLFPRWDQLVCTVTLYRNTTAPIFSPMSRYGKSIPNKVSIELKLHYHISCLPHIQLVIDSLLLGDTTQEHWVIMVTVRAVRYGKLKFKHYPTVDVLNILWIVISFG